MSNSRQTILSNTKKALNTASQIPDLYDQPKQQLKKKIIANRPKTKKELWKQFKKELQEVDGEFQLFENSDNIAEHISDFLKKKNYKQLAISGDEICQQTAEKIKAMDSRIGIVQATSFSGEDRKSNLASIAVSLVAANWAVAETGSAAVVYEQSRTSYPHFLAETVFAIVHQEKITADIFELFEKVGPEQAKNMVIISGPSRTADIEKILILGAHGPRRFIVTALSE